MKKYNFKGMKIFKCLTIACLVLLFSCKSTNKESDGSIVLKVENNRDAMKDDPIKITSFVDSVSFIKLEATENSLFSDVSGLYFIEDKIIVIDRVSCKVLVFTKDGKFLNQISRVGRGHGEHLGFAQCMFDEKEMQVMLYEYRNRRLIYYDLNGNYIRDITDFSGDDEIRDIINLPNGNFLCYAFDICEDDANESNTHAGLWEVDSLGRFVRSYKTYPKFYPFVLNVGNGYLSMLSDGRIAIRDGYFNDIYILENEKMTKYISYDIDRSNLLKLENQEYSQGQEPYTLCLASQIKGHYIFSQWTDDNQKLFATLYDMKKETFVCTDSIQYENEKFVAVKGWITDSNLDNAVVLSVNEVDIKSTLNDPAFSEKTKNKLKEVLNGESPDDMNGILEVLYLKK
jgi:hypothetical protein